MPELLTIVDVAKRLNVGRSKIYLMLAAGELHAVKIGRATRVSAAEVDRVVKALPAAAYSGFDRASRSPAT